jgi:MoxR-like ATPase
MQQPEWTDADLGKVAHLKEAHERILRQIRKAVVGQEQVINELMIVLFAQGNGFLMGVPGLAKTLLVRTLAASLSLQFSRVQFTPDLMPSDITTRPIAKRPLNICKSSPTGMAKLICLPGTLPTPTTRP